MTASGSTTHYVIIAIASMLFGLWLLMQLRGEIRTGVLRVGIGYGHPGQYLKSHSPYSYWIGIAMQGCIVALLLLVRTAFLAIQLLCIAAIIPTLQLQAL
jgi:hypothetical protein